MVLLIPWFLTPMVLLTAALLMTLMPLPLLPLFLLSLMLIPRRILSLAHAVLPLALPLPRPVKTLTMKVRRCTGSRYASFHSFKRFAR